LDLIQSQLNYNPADHVLQMLTMELIRSKHRLINQVKSIYYYRFFLGLGRLSPVLL